MHFGGDGSEDDEVVSGYVNEVEDTIQHMLHVGLEKRPSILVGVMATRKKKREKVVITGICGALGKLLALHLHKDFDVIGVDRRPFYDRPKDINHLRLDGDVNPPSVGSRKKNQI